MNRLLAISWEMPPMYGPRAAQVSRSLRVLADFGWRTTAVCLDPRRGGPHWQNGDLAEPPPGVDLVRVASPEEWFVTRAAFRLLPALGRLPDREWVWIGRAARSACAAGRSGDIAGLVTFAQPWSDHIAGLRVRRSTGLPWVAHFSDPWVDSPYIRGGWELALWRRMEASVIREADAVVFVTEEAADLVMRKYPAAWRDKVGVVPHGFAPHDVPASRTAERRPGPFRLVYTGRFYDDVRTPLALLDAVARLNATRPLAGIAELTFVGPHSEGYTAEAARRGLDRIVRFVPRVAAAEARKLAADADVLLVIDAPLPSKLGKGQIAASPFLPSKLVDYLPLRKLILGLTPLTGASAALLRRLGCPIAAPDDVAAIAGALEDLLRRWKDHAIEPLPVFAQVAAEYDIRCTTARLHEVLVRAFGRRLTA